MTETAEQALDAEHEPAPPRKIWVYGGPGPRTYPHQLDPETGSTLTVEPGDPFDFGEGMPPDDGLWYAVPSTGSPASTGAGETKE